MQPLFWDETHGALQDSIRRWVSDTIQPHAQAWEADKAFPRELYVQAEIGRAHV